MFEVPGSGESPGVVSSEFAAVSVSIDHDGNSARLRLEDLRSGAVRFVDALELESIVWAPEGWFRRLMDPSLHRWRDADAGPGIEAVGPERPGR
ncbi:hypothetical protein [Actinomycetospora chibensis]|uniref:Uncharacterized protein n=1 Tax=Actinomycetospora chibensis TaxID=663606 RepID=A0ABV9REA1_9PSEU|nr:hypothetical protein [Actinomycetospora chibensis]MDD7925071.1 hypothetical protein [Actinomycetospora chibensis]